MNKITCLTILALAMGTATFITNKDWVVVCTVFLVIAIISDSQSDEK